MTAPDPIFKPLPRQRSRLAHPRQVARAEAAHRAADGLDCSDDELLRVLHLRLAEADAAARRARMFGGRVWSWLRRQPPGYVPMPAPQLRRLLEIAGHPAPSELPEGSDWLLRLDVARTAYRRLRGVTGAA